MSGSEKWVVGPGNDDWSVDGPGDHTAVQIVAVGRKAPVAIVCEPGIFGGAIDRRARLIAAAPDLFHAAEEIIRTGLDEEARHGDQREAIALVRAALALALGGESAA